MRALMAVAAFIAGAVGHAHAQEAVNDPFEPVNRVVYAFNDVVDRAALEPIARGYRAIAPGPVRQGVSNVLNNLRGPVIFVNDLLQGEPGRAGVTAARFGLNTTVGLVGLIDVASNAGLERHDEDFGQTLGRWGAGGGPYLVLPLLGPSNLRDTIGRIGDAGLDPINYVDFRDDEIFRGTRVGLTVLDSRTQAIDAIASVRQTSVDPYVSVRTAYSILRNSSIRNGVTDLDALPDFEEAPTEALPVGPEEPPAALDAVPEQPPSDDSNIIVDDAT